MTESAEIQLLIRRFQEAVDGPLQDIALQQIRERRGKETLDGLRGTTPQITCCDLSHE